MPIPFIPRGEVHAGEEPEVLKFACPPTTGGGPIDPQPANFLVRRNLLIGKPLPLPAGVTTFEGRNEVEVWLLEDPDDPNEATSTTFPGKTIRIPQGAVVHAAMGARTNTHTIHWHGIEPTPMNDGVGHTSFEVSGNWIYQFQPNTAGTYFYHCHKNTVLHFEMGLYGLLIIDPPQGPGFASANAPTIRGFDPATFTIPIDVETAWVPDEFDSRWHVLGHDAFMQQCDQNDPVAPGLFTNDGILNDFRPDIFLITGVVSVPDSIDPATGASVGAVITDPAVATNAGVGQNILIRLLNAGYTIQEYTLGIDATVIAEDGHPLGAPPFGQYSFPFVVRANTPFRLTGARRWDLVVTPTRPGTFPFRVKYMDLNNGRVFHIAQTVIQVA